jgi:hypothetical protein
VREEGHWRREGQKLILNTNRQPLLNKKFGACDSLLIEVVDYDGQPVIFASIILTSESTKELSTNTDFDGQAKVAKDNFQAIRISDTGYHTIIANINNKYCYLKYGLLDGSHCSLTNQIYTIQGNKICSDIDEFGNQMCLNRITY